MPTALQAVPRSGTPPKVARNAPLVDIGVAQSHVKAVLHLGRRATEKGVALAEHANLLGEHEVAAP